MKRMGLLNMYFLHQGFSTPGVIQKYNSLAAIIMYVLHLLEYFHFFLPATT